MNLLLVGGETIVEFYEIFFQKQGINVFNINKMDPKDDFRTNIELGLVFGKMDVHSLEDTLKTLRNRFKDKIKFIPIVEDKNEYLFEILFQAGVETILFDFKPENILKEVNIYYENLKKRESLKNVESKYIINFYENKEIFFIDITGTVEKEKISQLKLMFMDYLKNKIDKIKGVVYIFNNTDENSMTFPHIWLLFRFWKILKIPYNKIYYLTTSDLIVNNIQTYMGNFGIHHSSNLLEIVTQLFPLFKNKSEVELFEFASSLIQTDYKFRPIQ